MRLSIDGDGGLEIEAKQDASFVIQNATDRSVRISRADLSWLIEVGGPAALAASEGLQQ